MNYEIIDTWKCSNDIYSTKVYYYESKDEALKKLVLLTRMFELNDAITYETITLIRLSENKIIRYVKLVRTEDNI